jgi:cysteine-rich repeat protein
MSRDRSRERQMRTGHLEMQMIRHQRLRRVCLSSIFGLSLAFAPGPALGQLTRLQQVCTNALNKGLTKVTQAQGKVNSQCIKDGRKGNTGKLGADETIEGCLTADVQQKVARKTQATREKAIRRCEPPLPTFGATDAETVNAAAIDQDLALIHDIFNTRLDTVIVLAGVEGSPESAASKCQEKIAVQTQKCMDTRFREFERCKKNGLRGGRIETLYPGADDPFDDAADLELCMGWDRKAKIAACLQQLREKIGQNCECVALGTATSGACFDAPDLAECLDRLTACRSCLAMNEGDDLNRNCDEFDDGVVNGTCPPVLPFCGDGTVQEPVGEECDDGGTQGGDGCDGFCQQEPGFVCQGEPSGCASSCANGVVDLGEACDDGNQTDDDGCSDNCQIEGGYGCAGAPSTCDPICGDGLVRGDEGCDDADPDDGDGCSSSCDVEPGYACLTAPAFLECEEPSRCAPTCGNGMVNELEGCDDGNPDDGDGCSSSCEIEPGFTCLGQPSFCIFTCGSGTIEGTEGCDDGNTDEGDGCSGVCEVEPGFDCQGEPSVCSGT